MFRDSSMASTCEVQKNACREHWLVEETVSLVFGLLITELDSRTSEFSQFVADHIVCDFDGQIILAIVNHESKPDKGRDNGAAACLCTDRCSFLESLGERGRE